MKKSSNNNDTIKQTRMIKKTLQFIGRESILCSSDAHLAKPDEKYKQFDLEENKKK